MLPAITSSPENKSIIAAFLEEGIEENTHPCITRSVSVNPATAATIPPAKFSHNRSNRLTGPSAEPNGLVNDHGAIRKKPLKLALKLRMADEDSLRKGISRKISVRIPSIPPAKLQ
jgi:hypothetical protein